MLDLICFMFFFELSGMGGMDSLYMPGEDHIENVYELQTYLTLGACMEIGVFYLKGNARILMYPMSDSINFFPCALRSIFEVGVAWRGLSLAVKRECKHPITPLNDYGEHSSFSDSASYEVLVRYETGKIKL